MQPRHRDVHEGADCVSVLSRAQRGALVPPVLPASSFDNRMTLLLLGMFCVKSRDNVASFQELGIHSEIEHIISYFSEIGAENTTPAIHKLRPDPVPGAP